MLLRRGALIISSGCKKVCNYWRKAVATKGWITDWTMTLVIEENCHCPKKDERAQPQRMDSTVSEATKERLEKRRDMKSVSVIWNIPPFWRFIIGRLKDDLKDFYICQRRAKASQRKQIQMKCWRGLLLWHLTITALMSKGGRITDRRNM